LPLSYVVVLSENANGGFPSGTDAQAYADVLGLKGFPVTADLDQRVLVATPWTGLSRPGKCVLSPDMVMIDCYVGDDDTRGFAAIRAHAGL
jgi:hypothetical protein